MLFKWFFQRTHKKAVTTLRGSVDILLKREREDPDGFADCGMVLPIVLAGIRVKSKRPADIILNPLNLTYQQRADIIRHIDEETARMNAVFKQNTSDDAAYITLICLNWLEILHQAHFRSADMPDILPELTAKTRDDITNFIFRALDAGSEKLAALNEAEADGRPLH